MTTDLDPLKPGPVDSEALSPRRALTTWVTGRVTILSNAYREDQSWAVRALAVMRRDGVDSPGVWEQLASLPPALVAHGDQLSRGELAATHALRLFAIHQQARRTQSMHKSGAGLGEALRRIDPDPDPGKAIMRRFHALCASPTVEGCAYHLRGLVQQLRGADLPLDYGRLAGDLWDWHIPRNQSQVRLRWNRGFFTYRPPQTDDSSETSSSTPGEQA